MVMIPVSQSSAHQRHASRLLVAAIVLAVAAVPLMPFDVTVASWIHLRSLPGDLHRLIDYSEVFGHGIGVSLIIITAAILDPRGWRVLVVLASYSLGSGLLADAVKLVVARYRPYAFDMQAGNSLDTWIDWFPWIHGFGLHYDKMSFPSAHTATAVGLACGLSRLYPRGSLMFALFACLAASQRLVEQAHFPSDVVCGAALALLLCAALERPRSLTSRILYGASSMASPAPEQPGER